MLIKQRTLRRIVAGEIRVAYRKWKRATVRSGGTLMTSLGQLAVESVERVELNALSEIDARDAGFGSLDELLRILEGKADGDIYRIVLRYAGPDPRASLRDEIPDAEELELLCAKIRKSEDRSDSPWRVAALQTIRAQPETRAAELAVALGFETKRFKSNVRTLKALGLTQSMGIGYRLSPRGEAVLVGLERRV